MTTTCPSCGAEQSQSLLCHTCTTRLERDLGDVASIVADLDITMSRQDRVPSSGGAPSSPKGKEDDAGLSAIAHTRTPINFGAVQAADNLGNVLTTWARDVGDEAWQWSTMPSVSIRSARILLSNIDAIRRHPAVKELADEISDAIAQARRVVDRPADRIYLGQCMVPTQDEEGNDVTCWEEIYASPGAFEARCKVCGITHVVTDRRENLLKKSEDFLFSVRESATIIGSYGELQITESTIRNYISSGQIAYHGKVDGNSVIRMGDLLAVIRKHAAKPKGRKLKRAV